MVAQDSEKMCSVMVSALNDTATTTFVPGIGDWTKGTVSTFQRYDRQVYHAGFAEDQFHGKAKIIYTDGNVYEGLMTYKDKFGPWHQHARAVKKC